jgi:hypothetical protein
VTATPPAPAQPPALSPPVAPDSTPATRRPFVTAILVCRVGATAATATAAAIEAQTRPVDRLVAVDLTAGIELGAILADAGLGSHGAVSAVTVIRPAGSGRGPGSRPGTSAVGPVGPLVNEVVAQLAPPPQASTEWLWLVADDVAPEPDALARLVDAVRRSPSVGVAGPKVLDRERPRLLIEVGHQLTRSGRVIADPWIGEPDQGQFDTRTDVLAVGLPGMVVRRALFEQLGGFEAAFGGPGEALDLGWRAQLAGERVVVVPRARVYLGPPPAASLPDSVTGPSTAPTEAPASPASPPTAPSAASAPSIAAVPSGASDSLAHRRAARSAARRVALARCSPWVAPLLAGWVLVSSLVSALVLLVLKRPAHAWVELGDLGALAHPVSAVGARWRFRRHRRLRRRDLATLFVTSGDALRHTADRVQDALTPDRSEQDRATLASEAGSESGPVAEEAEDLNVQSASIPERIFTNPGVLVTVGAALVGAVGFRSSLRGGLLDARGTGLAGGELSRVATDAAGLWHAFRDSWHGAGWGTSADSGPYVGILAALTWLVERLPYVGGGRSPASVMLAWTLVLGMPLATSAAYLAGRVVTTARWPRALVALAWGTTGVLATSISQGRVTLVLAHMVVPLVAAGVVRAARAEGTFTAAAATALGAGVLGALVPPYLALVALAAVGLVVVGPGWARRVRGLALLVLPLGLQGAWLEALRDPVTWLAAPGALDAAGAGEPPWWALLAGFPDGGATWLLVVSSPVLIAGVLALIRRPTTRGHAVAMASLVLLALVGLGWGLLARRVVVGSALGVGGALEEATPWPGIGLQLYLLALLALALLGSVGMRTVLRGTRFAPRRVVAGTGLAILTAAVVTSGALIGWSRLDGVVGVGFDALPAVAVEQARGPEANRLLTLAVSDAGVEYELIAREPGDVLRGPTRPGTAADPGVATAVAALVAGRTGTGSGPAAALANLGVGFVSVQGTPAPGVIRTLDATAGLTRLGNTDDQILWRVLARPSVTTPTDVVPASRAWITTADGRPSAWVRVDGAHGALSAPVPAGPTGRRLVLAEPREWIDHADVRFDGVRLESTGTGLPTYVLPERPGLLTVDIPPNTPRWFAAQLALLGLTVFLAVPFGNRRSRRVR